MVNLGISVSGSEEFPRSSSSQQTPNVLNQISCSADQIGRVLMDVFQLSDSQTARVLRYYFSSDTVTSTLEHVFNDSYWYFITYIMNLFG